MDGMKQPEDTTPAAAPLPPAGENLENNPQTPPATQPVVSAPQTAPDQAQTVSAPSAGKGKMWMIVGALVLVTAIGVYLVFA
jgi:hypothetical protein